MQEIAISSISEFRIGNAQNIESGTGCTAILSPGGAVAGVDVRGGAPGTRETDLLRPENTIEKVHAVSLAGGSAFGLEAAAGIADFLEEKKIGYDTGIAKIPIVPSAILFDLGVGKPNIRPNKEMGYQAAESAWNHQPLEEGNHGCGTGASIGKCLGASFMMKSGLGSYAVQVGDLKVGAIIGVNAFGDIIDPSTNQIIGGVYDRMNKKFLYSEEQMIAQTSPQKDESISENTTIGAILTNACLTKANATKISSIAHDGIARTHRPSHTFMDGDTLFTLSSGKIQADVNTVGILAVRVVEKAILRAVSQAKEAYGLPVFSSH